MDNKGRGVPLYEDYKKDPLSDYNIMKMLLNQWKKVKPSANRKPEKIKAAIKELEQVLDDHDGSPSSRFLDILHGSSPGQDYEEPKKKKNAEAGRGRGR